MKLSDIIEIKIERPGSRFDPEQTAIRFVRFWGTILVYNYLKPLGKIPVSEEAVEPITEIYHRIFRSLYDYGFIEFQETNIQ